MYIIQGIEFVIYVHIKKLSFQDSIEIDSLFSIINKF